MNKKMLFAATTAAVLLASCQVSRKAVSSARIAGEWNIVEVNGEAVKAQPYPYIGFDTKNSRIYGNSGCNHITGGFELKGKSGKITLGQMASTMMAGPDMELEQHVLAALSSVKRIGHAGADKLALYDAGKRPVMQLEKRFREVAPDDIRGEWRIVRVFGKKLSGMKQVPFINFDTQNSRISAYAGCNRIMGGFRTEAPNTISFSGVVSTKMACPDMDAERNVLTALGQAKSFGLLTNGNLALFSASGNLVVELMRNR